jgi:hypothetical protein
MLALPMDKQPTAWRQPVHIHMQQTTTLIAVVPQLAVQAQHHNRQLFTDQLTLSLSTFSLRLAHLRFTIS